MGYYPKASKSWLIVKLEYLEIANLLFEGTNVNITTEGRRHLGAVIGSDAYKEEYLSGKVNVWIEEIIELTKIARSQPHAAYTSLTKGLQHRYTYYMRTIPNISHLLKPLDDDINSFIKVLFNGYEFSEIEGELWSLPAKYGGLGITIPSKICDMQYQNSQIINERMTNKVIDQDVVFDNDLSKHTRRIKQSIKNVKTNFYKEKLENIKRQMKNQNKLRALESCLEKGASSWINALPLKIYGFHLDKHAFWDWWVYFYKTQRS